MTILCFVLHLWVLPVVVESWLSLASTETVGNIPAATGRRSASFMGIAYLFELINIFSCPDHDFDVSCIEGTKYCFCHGVVKQFQVRFVSAYWLSVWLTLSNLWVKLWMLGPILPILVGCLEGVGVGWITQWWCVYGTTGFMYRCGQCQHYGVRLSTHWGDCCMLNIQQ